ncbi:MAG: hypothetical protein M1833_006614 [Piccolia ochrophora]|nr:MAG: hypothetical protein M1833_006614 [Piccolia ochrophora]
MLLFVIGALCLSFRAVSAFQDTSPFFLFSTLDLPVASSEIPQVLASSSLFDTVKESLGQCRSDVYVIVSQPHVNGADFTSAKAAPRLAEMVSGGKKNGVKSSFGVSDVIGDLNVDGLQAFLEKKCKAEVSNIDASTGSFKMVEDMKPRVIRVEFPAPPTSKVERARQLVENDAFLSSIIDLLPSRKYTTIYTTTGITSKEAHTFHEHGSHDHQANKKAPAYSELKYRATVEDDNDKPQNVTLIDGPLFERYQFLSPALFMSLLVIFVLLTLLTIGIRAISSLQVSYAAFDKDMGPAAQKKQQ